MCGVVLPSAGRMHHFHIWPVFLRPTRDELTHYFTFSLPHSYTPQLDNKRKRRQHGKNSRPPHPHFLYCHLDVLSIAAIFFNSFMPLFCFMLVFLLFFSTTPKLLLPLFCKFCCIFFFFFFFFFGLYFCLVLFF